MRSEEWHNFFVPFFLAIRSLRSVHWLFREVWKAPEIVFWSVCGLLLAFLLLKKQLRLVPFLRFLLVATMANAAVVVIVMKFKTVVFCKAVLLTALVLGVLANYSGNWFLKRRFLFERDFKLLAKACVVGVLVKLFI
jgi:hypothetical protein